MICRRCKMGELKVMRTYSAGRGKTQQRQCSSCKIQVTFVVIEHEGSESAYILARRMSEEEKARDEN